MYRLAAFVSALLLAGAAHASDTYSAIRGPLGGKKPIKLYAAPGAAGVTAEIAPDELASWIAAGGEIPVLEEKDVFIRFRTPAGKEVWALSEKLEIKRDINCGGPTPEATVKTAKVGTEAARGIGEACKRKGK